MSNDWRWTQKAARPLRPDVVVLDRGSEHWRGAQLFAVDVGAQTATLRILLEQHHVGDRTIALALVPVDARAIGNPLVVRIEGTNPDDYTVAEVRGSYFPGRMGPGSDQIGSVQRGIFHPGAIPRSIHGQSVYYDGD